MNWTKLCDCVTGTLLGRHRFCLSPKAVEAQHAEWPTFSAAWMSAVVPFFCRPFTFAPFLRSSLSRSSCPPAAASITSVIPLESCVGFVTHMVPKSVGEKEPNEHNKMIRMNASKINVQELHEEKNPKNFKRRNEELNEWRVDMFLKKRLKM